MTTDMALLLTILSVLALWALLGVLVMGLLFIFKPLQSVRLHLEKIAMGVRAIERQTAPLGEWARKADPALSETRQAFTGATEQLSRTDHLLS